MRTYRLYFMDADGLTVGYYPWLSPGDDDAIEVGTVRAASRPMELWQADRKVMTYGNDEVTPNP
jgi:hypothetical protein